MSALIPQGNFSCDECGNAFAAPMLVSLTGSRRLFYSGSNTPLGYLNFEDSRAARLIKRLLQRAGHVLSPNDTSRIILACADPCSTGTLFSSQALPCCPRCLGPAVHLVNQNPATSATRVEAVAFMDFMLLGGIKQYALIQGLDVQHLDQALATIRMPRGEHWRPKAISLPELMAPVPAPGGSLAQPLPTLVPDLPPVPPPAAASPQRALLDPGQRDLSPVVEHPFFGSEEHPPAASPILASRNWFRWLWRQPPPQDLGIDLLAPLPDHAPSPESSAPQHPGRSLPFLIFVCVTFAGLFSILWYIAYDRSFDAHPTRPTARIVGTLDIGQAQAFIAALRPVSLILDDPVFPDESAFRMVDDFLAQHPPDAVLIQGVCDDHCLDLALHAAHRVMQANAQLALHVDVASKAEHLKPVIQDLLAARPASDHGAGAEERSSGTPGLQNAPGQGIVSFTAPEALQAGVITDILSDQPASDVADKVTPYRERAWYHILEKQNPALTNAMFHGSGVQADVHAEHVMFQVLATAARKAPEPELMQYLDWIHRSIPVMAHDPAVCSAFVTGQDPESALGRVPSDVDEGAAHLLTALANAPVKTARQPEPSAEALVAGLKLAIARLFGADVARAYFNPKSRSTLSTEKTCVVAGAISQRLDDLPERMRSIVYLAMPGLYWE